MNGKDVKSFDLKVFQKKKLKKWQPIPHSAAGKTSEIILSLWIIWTFWIEYRKCDITRKETLSKWHNCNRLSGDHFVKSFWSNWTELGNPNFSKLCLAVHSDSFLCLGNKNFFFETYWLLTKLYLIQRSSCKPWVFEKRHSEVYFPKRQKWRPTAFRQDDKPWWGRSLAWWVSCTEGTFLISLGAQTAPLHERRLLSAHHFSSWLKLLQ